MAKVAIADFNISKVMGCKIEAIKGLWGDLEDILICIWLWGILICAYYI